MPFFVCSFEAALEETGSRVKKSSSESAVKCARGREPRWKTVGGLGGLQLLAFSSGTSAVWPSLAIRYDDASGLGREGKAS